MKRFLFLFLLILIFLPTADAQLVIGPPETVSETRITRTIFEYVMRAKITNAGPAAAAISATVTSSSPKTVIVQNTLTFGNVGAATTADSTGTFTLRHDRTVPFDPAVLHWTIKQPFIVSAATPTAGASEVGVTVRPQVFFSKPVDPATLNANNFFAKGPDGQKLPATILPANDATFAWLFFTAPMPGASQVQVTVDGATIRLAGGADLLDAANTGTPGSKLTFDFSTVSLAPLANTTVWGRIVDPGPDLLPHTADDSQPGPDGQYMTEDDIHLLPIAGVKVFLIGLENQAVFTDAAGRFQIDGVPSGNVKVVIDGRTARAPPTGYYFPEMVMDATMQPGLNNFVMKGMESMYLPRIPNSILQAVSASQTTTVTLKPEAALDLPPAQQPFLTVEVQPGSLVNNGQHVATGQVGISVVPPELVRDMLPPGLLQHTFDITVQAPGITNFSTPAAMTFPNVFNAPPGTKLHFLSFDHTTGRLVIEGTATVSANGLFVHTDPATGITYPGWHGLTPPGAVGTGGPITRCNAQGPSNMICLDHGSLTGGVVVAAALEVCINESVTFNVSGVTDTGGRKRIIPPCPPPVDVAIPPGPITYEWKIFRDGNVVSSGSTPSASVTATAAGIYTCQFTAKSQRECPPNDITVPGSPSVKVAGLVKVTATGNGVGGQISLCQNAEISFDVQVQQINCGNLTYAWTFSDGDTSTSKSPTHLFHAGPPYSATVTVSCSAANCSDSKSSSISVNIGEPLQSVDGKADGQDAVTVYVGQPVAFTAITDPPNMVDATYTWDFGDGTTASGASAYHWFLEDKTVQITVSCGAGPAKTDTIAVHVTDPPLPPIAADIVDDLPPGSAFKSGIDQGSIILKLKGRIVMPLKASIPNGIYIYYVPNANEVQNPGTVLVELNASDNAKGDGTVGNTVNGSWPYTLP